MPQASDPYEAPTSDYKDAVGEEVAYENTILEMENSIEAEVHRHEVHLPPTDQLRTPPQTRVSLRMPQGTPKQFVGNCSNAKVK